MNVVLYGASGMIGSRVLKELLHRGHTVTAVVRNPEKVSAVGAQVVMGDVTDSATVAATAKGADAAISAYSPPHTDVSLLGLAVISLLAGLSKAGVNRLIVVGGALGIGTALTTAQLLRSLLFNIGPRDPFTYVAVAFVLCLVALAATLIPARAAMKVDPVVALRYE